MDVEQLRPGLWRWTAPHPEWKDGDDWGQEVGSAYYEAPGATVLFDPLVPPERERFLAALDRDVERRGLPVAILLTVPWHERSAAELTGRYAATDAVPDGVEPFAVREADETIWWLPEHGALVVGDVLLGTADGRVRVCPDSWLPTGVTGPAVRERLRHVLDLPIELVLLAHGAPLRADGRAALELALGG
jgi:glyoxylase-like metal-dependent hydrolase (beta-lactamase superfamily II)